MDEKDISSQFAILIQSPSIITFYSAEAGIFHLRMFDYPFLDCLFCLCLLFQQSSLYDHFRFIVSLEIEQFGLHPCYSSSRLFCQLVSLLCFLPFHTNFNNSLLTSTKELDGMLIVIELKPQTKMGIIEILTTLSVTI